MRIISRQSPDHVISASEHHANVGAGQTNTNAHANMEAPFNERGVVVGVNFKLLHAALLSVVAWVIWPPDPKWWGFYMFSIILGVASVAIALEAIRSAIKLNNAKKRWAALQAMGNAPKNARIAGKHDLRHGGMN